MRLDDIGQIYGRWRLVHHLTSLGLSSVPDNWLTLEIISGVIAHVDLANGYLNLQVSPECSPETVTHCLYDLIIPRLLAHDGQLVIHGGLSFAAAGAVGFIGKSGRGKSTLVAGLHGLGLPLMGDDAFILDPSATGYEAQRVYASLRLFPDSVDTLFSDVGDTTLVAHYSTKRRVPFAEGPESAPLLALFQLAEPEPEIRLRKLSMAETCMALVSNSFVLDVDNIAETRVKFGLASAAAQTIPVYDLYYPRTYDRLPEVCAAILDTVAGVSAKGPAL